MRYLGLFHCAVLGALIAPLVGCGDPEIVVPDALRVIAILPAHGSTGIAVDVEPLVYFSHPLANPETAPTAVTLECVGAPPCAAADNTVCAAANATLIATYDAAAQAIRLSPDPGTPLLATTCYDIAVAEGLAAAEAGVAPLPATIRSRFLTR